MTGESVTHLFSQLVYLDLPAGVKRAGPPTVGALADYYTGDPVGRAYLKTRFGGIPREYEDWKRFLAQGVDRVRGWRIRNVLDDNWSDGTGFYACTYLSREGEAVAAFRGSEMLGNRRYRNDYETDFALAYSAMTPQQERARDYLRLFPDFRERPYTLTGHSLGGNLALYAAVHAPEPERLTVCHAFNAPGFSEEFLARDGERIHRVTAKLQSFQNEHDLVSSLLLGIGEPVVLQSAIHPRDMDAPGVGDILSPHSNFLFVPAGEGFARAEGGKDALCATVNALTRLLLLLPVFVRKGLAGILLDVIYSSQPPEKQMEFLLERVTKYLVRSGSEAGSLALSGGLYVARQLEPASNSDLYRALLDGGHDEHAGLAKATLLLLDLVRYGCLGDSCPAV